MLDGGSAPLERGSGIMFAEEANGEEAPVGDEGAKGAISTQLDVGLVAEAFDGAEDHWGREDPCGVDSSFVVCPVLGRPELHH